MLLTYLNSGLMVMMAGTPRVFVFDANIFLSVTMNLFTVVSGQSQSQTNGEEQLGGFE